VDTKTVVALIAVAAVALQVAVSYLFSRQNDNDLRRNIDRDIDLIRALRPGSDEVAGLEGHVRNSIADLVAGDQRRKHLRATLSTLSSLQILVLAVWALTLWRERGIPRLLQPVFDVAYWPLMLGTLGYAAWGIAHIVWSRCGTLLPPKLGRVDVRARWLQLRTWNSNRRTAKLESRVAEARRQFAALRDYERHIMALVLSNKDVIIERSGQASWNQMMARNDEFEQKAAEFEEQFPADEPAPGVAG
jgi:hypothetical protein